MRPTPSTGLVFGFAALAILVASLFVVANVSASLRLGDDASTARRIAIRSLFGATLWLTMTAAVAGRGLWARFDVRPPPLLLLFVAVLAVSNAIGLSRTGERLARGLPIAALVGLQAFRLPLELLMHQAAREGVMPQQMSFSGLNFDIVTGITAIGVALVAGLGRAGPKLIAAWNVLGILLLAVILGLAFASTPMIHAFGEDPHRLNTFVAYVPFVWLPAVLVVAAISGHIIVTRRLLMDAHADATHARSSPLA
jgi:hypothetical protein